jgi:hypothetical protein
MPNFDRANRVDRTGWEGDYCIRRLESPRFSRYRGKNQIHGLFAEHAELLDRAGLAQEWLA